jgi:formylglycine-generating enzyme required for sulfatase activity
MRRRLRTTLLIFHVAVAALLVEADPSLAQEPIPTPAAENRVFLPIVERTSGLVLPLPAAAAVDQSLNAYLAWQFLDPGLSDPRFTILLEAGDDTPDVTVAENRAAFYVDPATFELDTVYYWQVIATGSNGVRQVGPVWSFRTAAWLDQPPIGTMAAVPAGEFQMGCDSANPGPALACARKDTPLHAVWLDAYAIDRFEVTNREYQACVAAGQCQPPRRARSHEREAYYGNPGYDLYPVLYVSHWDAVDYCAWAGKRLPTEAEWEKAARGAVDTRPFPWGDEPADCSRQNRPIEGICSDQPDDTARVGSYPRGASVYGVYDLGGNAFEWVLDQYSETWYQNTPYLNPINTTQGQRDAYTLRGGSYRDRIAYTRVFHRHWGHHGDTVGGDAPYYRNDRAGFRCARSLP